MRILKQAGQWLAAAVIAMLLCNGLLYGYHDPAAWIDRENAPTDAIWRPGSRLVMGTEGRGVHSVDARGYLNPGLPLAENFTLVVGSSFTQGKEVAAGERFVDLMNAALAETEQELAVYSVSQDGFYLPDIVRCFPALMQELPGARTLVIETGTTAFSEETLAAAQNQHRLDETQRGAEILHRMSLAQKAVLYIKEALPVLTLGKTQLTAMRDEEAVPVEHAPASDAALDAALGLLRAQFDGRIIVLYHPSIEITPEGALTVLEEETTESFRQACERSGLEFLDVSAEFAAAFARDHAVPYGFSNTTMGSGHLNAHGHRICAKALIEVLKGGGGK